MNSYVQICLGSLVLVCGIGLSTQQGVTVAPSCTSRNASCGDCVGFSSYKCLWCPSKDPPCIEYPAGEVFPNSVCQLSEARWLNCSVNLQAVLITMGVLAALIVIAISVCIYCCCCRTNSARAARREQHEEARVTRERAERQAKHDERKAERQSKYDEIRRKYGLSGGTSQYSRFENERSSDA